MRTILPSYIEKTKWVLAGASKAEMKDRTRAALASHQIAMPEPGALAFMLSREGITAAGQHFRHPHVMICLAHTDGADWGADLHGSPIIAEQADPEPITTFDVMVPSSSDGMPPTMEHIPTEDIIRTSFRLGASGTDAYRSLASDGVLRVSVGLENSDDLIQDLAQALG